MATKTRSKLPLTLIGVAALVVGFAVYDAELPMTARKRKPGESTYVRWELTMNATTNALVSSHSSVHGDRIHYDDTISGGLPTGHITLEKNEVLSLTVTAELSRPRVTISDAHLMCRIDVNGVKVDQDIEIVKVGKISRGVACQHTAKG